MPYRLHRRRTLQMKSIFCLSRHFKGAKGTDTLVLCLMTPHGFAVTTLPSFSFQSLNSASAMRCSKAVASERIWCISALPPLKRARETRSRDMLRHGHHRDFEGCVHRRASTKYSSPGYRKVTLDKGTSEPEHRQMIPWIQ